MLNDLFRTYKKIIIFALVLLCGIIFWFYGCHRQKNNSVETEEWKRIALPDSYGYEYRFRTGDLSGTVVFGTQGHLVKNKTLPVTLNINCEEDSFTGILKITLPGEDGRGVAYQSAVNCTKGIKSKVVLEVPQLGNASYLCFEILDQFGVTKFFEIITPDDLEDGTGEEDLSFGEKVCVGVLSEHYDSLGYLDGMEIETEKEKIKLKLIRLSENSFPTDVRQLEAFSGILIDSFDTSKLSQMQLFCLKQWVSEKGGNLMLSTGENMDAVLSGVGDIFGILPGNITETRYHFFDESVSIGTAYLTNCNLSFKKKKAWTMSELSSPAAMYGKEFGRGHVSVLLFSLLDDAFLQWTGRDKSINSFLSEYLMYGENDFQVDNTSLWYIKRALYSFQDSQLPNTFYYGVFFIVYLIILGFFAYYLLRRIKKREYIWIVVPVIAVFFTICLTIRARGIAGGIENSFSAIRVIDEKNYQDDIYFLYQNDEGESCNVNLLPSVKAVEPLDYDYLMDEVDVSSLRGANQDFTINNTKNGFDLVFEESIPGISQVLKYSMESKRTDNSENFFRHNITGDYTSFGGEVSNISPYDFDKVVLIRGNQYAIVNGLEEGETLQVKEENVKCWSGYDEGNQAFGEGDETTVMGNLLEYLQQQYISANTESQTLLIIGITKENDFKLFADENVLKNHLTIFVNHFEMPFEEGADSIMNMNTSCIEDEEQVPALKEDILEKNRTEVTYVFDSRKVAWALARNRDHFEGTIYAYNYDTQEEDVILDKKNDFLNCEALEPYVSDMNKIKLTFCMKGNMEYGAAPVLSLITKDMD